MKRLLMGLTIICLCASCNQGATIETKSTNDVPPMTITSTETQAISQVEQLLTAYLAGESIDVSGLSPAEFAAFSAELAEKRNAERGINPIVYNNEAYISPDNYMMMNYDGHPDQNETIAMYLPIAGKDSEGNLQIVNHDGEIVTIENSANVDWNMRVTDPNDLRIDWPTTKVLESGFVEAQYRVFSPNNPTHLIPAILLDNRMGQLFLQGIQPAMVPSIRFLLIETDNQNNPLLAREIISIGAPKFNLFIEGSSLDKESDIIALSTTNVFFDNLDLNCIYYIGGPTDQTKFYINTMQANIDNYHGILNADEIYPVLMVNKKNDIDMIVLATSVLLKNN